MIHIYLMKIKIYHLKKFLFKSDEKETYSSATSDMIEHNLFFSSDFFFFFLIILLNILNFKLYTLYPVSCILYPVSCILYPVSCILYPVSCTLYSVLCFLYSTLISELSNSKLCPRNRTKKCSGTFNWPQYIYQ